jgi:glycolate oxidase iron-sulfur subunit
MCLQACPTYLVFGTEMDGPRGRIALMRAAVDGQVTPDELNDVLAEHLGRCLACRACETACPSGVRYGTLIETTRIALESHRALGVLERFIRWLAFRQMMPHVERLKFVARLMWLYEATGLQRLFRALNVLPTTLGAMEAVLPPIVPKYRNYRKPAPAIGDKCGEVAFFIGCIQEAFLSQANEATIRVLQRNGYEVYFPAGQTCCGAAQLHTGEGELARDLARKNIDAFLARDYQAIINNAGGCGATLKHEYVDLLKDDPVYAERAKQFCAKVKDISEFLIDHLHVPPQGQVRVRATYSDSCHLRHAQKIIKPPRELLKRIPGLQLVELGQPDRCCGSAGVYNIVQSNTANAVLDMKMADIAAIGADLIVTSNTGCHMQLIAGVRRAGLKAQVKHVAEVLDISYRAMGDQ